ncbi:hypothetical protein [Novosphingobium sp.]|jgi:hypothetical protein|uniref:hypothetical protein n=1 Tax=Novosphingobium sp. TaxID=1874826 RepID=UPI002FE09F20
MNDRLWSTAAGKAERLLPGIENLALSVRQGSDWLNWDKPVISDHARERQVAL